VPSHRPFLMDPAGEVTRLLARLSEGEQRAADELLPLIYAELYRVASEFMVGRRPGDTLQPTALVHEAYLRLLPAEGAQ
jgi:RNA polymerase sigma-70 factor (ECF subfamily)